MINLDYLKYIVSIFYENKQKHVHLMLNHSLVRYGPCTIQGQDIDGF